MITQHLTTNLAFLQFPPTDNKAATRLSRHSEARGVKSTDRTVLFCHTLWPFILRSGDSRAVSRKDRLLESELWLQFHSKAACSNCPESFHLVPQLKIGFMSNSNISKLEKYSSNDKLRATYAVQFDGLTHAALTDFYDIQSLQTITHAHQFSIHSATAGSSLHKSHSHGALAHLHESGSHSSPGIQYSNLLQILGV